MYLKGELILEKSFWKRVRRCIPVFDKRHEYIGDRYIEFDQYHYFARYKDSNSGYRLNKKNYQDLLKTKARAREGIKPTKVTIKN